MVVIPTSKADIYTLAGFGDITSFTMKYTDDVLNVPDDNGSTLLHHALSGRHYDIARFLVLRGADVNAKNRNGQTSLHYACMYSNVDLIKLMVVNGADLSITDNWGNTPIWTAAFNSKRWGYDVINYLMSLQPNVNIQNNAGLTPLDIAVRFDDNILMSILIKGSSV